MAYSICRVTREAQNVGEQGGLLDSVRNARPITYKKPQGILGFFVAHWGNTRATPLKRGVCHEAPGVTSSAGCSYTSISFNPVLESGSREFWIILTVVCWPSFQGQSMAKRTSFSLLSR